MKQATKIALAIIQVISTVASVMDLILSILVYDKLPFTIKDLKVALQIFGSLSLIIATVSLTRIGDENMPFCVYVRKALPYIVSQVLAVAATCFRLILFVYYYLNHWKCYTDTFFMLEPNGILFGISAVLGAIGIFVFIICMGFHMYKKLPDNERKIILKPIYYIEI